ncbi:MAG: endonuclease/exonuclease/phosphatase family protein [Burkholderiaceae bacterium]
MNRLHVGSLNLLNLRLPGRPFYGNPGYKKNEYKRKLTWTANMFDQLQCPLLAVQEVFDEQALRDCAKASAVYQNAASIVAPHAASPDNELPRVGLISSLPLLGPVESIVDIPPSAAISLPGAPEIGLPPQDHRQFSRPVLATTVNLGTEALPVAARLYVIHLKSRRPKRLDNEQNHDSAKYVAEDMDDPIVETRAHLRALMMRSAEATGIRQLLLKDLVNSRTPVMVLGDFNDHAKAMTTALICGRTVARRLDRRDYTLWHAGALARPNVLKRDVGYTNIYMGEPGSIDHILLSEEFMRESRHAIGEVVRVDWFNDHLNNRHDDSSDHGAIRASLQIKMPSPSKDAPASSTAKKKNQPRKKTSRRPK